MGLRHILLLLLLAAPLCALEPQRVKLVLSEAPVDVVVRALAAAGGYDLVMPSLPGITVSVHLTDATVLEALVAIEDVTGVEFDVRGKLLVVFRPGTRPLVTRVYPVTHLDPARLEGALAPAP